MYKKIIFVCAAFVGAFVTPEATANIALSTTDVIFNFNFASPPASPPPPYTLLSSVIAEVDFNAPSGNQASLVIDLYGDLNGSNLAVTIALNAFPTPYSLTNIGLQCTPGPGCDPLLLDGIFSIGIHVTLGPAEFIGNTMTVSMNNAAGGTTSITSGPVGASVPEPATLALVGLGLSGLALTRRRKSH